MTKKADGYTILLLMFVVFVMSIGLMIAVPVWQTQIQREKEAELIFRGKQYVEAVRLFQRKKPGTFPKNFKELLKEKCLRKLFEDPISPDGKWNLILLSQRAVSQRSRQARRGSRRSQTRNQASQGRSQGAGVTFQRVLVAPQSALSKIDNPQIIGVVSASAQTSIKIYNGQNIYNKWLFFYGQEPGKLPEIVYYGQEEKD